jgi:flagellar M-ring protein FliF
MELPFKLPAAAVAGVVLVAVLGAGAVWWVLSGGDDVLFDHLGAAQLNGISAELDRAGIPYRVDREKSAIAVAHEDTGRARLAVMASGNALRDTVGLELFDKSDFGMTDFAQKINYQRAMEGEIARTVSSLEEVKYARVHLVLPEHGLFQKDKQRPRASVTLFLNQDAALTAEQVKSVQRIAASAVPELTEQDVIVVNQNGVTLSPEAGDAEQSTAASARLTQQKAVESYLADKIRRVLGQALGAGRFAVSVDVALDLNQRTTTTEKVLDAGGENGVKRIKASSSRNQGETGGEDTAKEIEYALGHESEQIVHGAGEIKRLQIGVIIDKDVQGVDVARLRELVATAAGIDAARGDKIAIVQNNVAVQKALRELSGATDTAAQPLAPHAPTGSPMLTALLFLAGLLAGAVAVWLLRPVRGKTLNETEVQRLRLELRQWVNSENAGIERLGEG